jgi:hypothetical protein
VVNFKEGGGKGSPLFAFRPVLFVLLAASIWVVHGHSTFTSYADVRHVLESLAEILPSELRIPAPVLPEAAWSAWAARHDREIRDRLERGDEDTIVNWLLFGTSFTSRPRIFLDARGSDAAALAQLVAARTQDLVAALQAPGSDERRLFAKRLIERKGFRLDTVAGREQVAAHLIADVTRVAQEQVRYTSELAETRRLGDVSAEFAARSRLFRSRGLSLDTSILPNFALEQSLRQLHARGLIRAGSIRAVAVIGPGLDFSDKSSGYDFYPQQTLQPFALIDSLVRLGLAATPTAVRVTTLDLSPRVNSHVMRARQRASAGLPYVLRVPFDPAISWKPELVAYWKEVGDRIGAVGQTDAPVAGGNLRLRTIRVQPQIVSQIQAEDLNIVVQRVADRRFDLIVATNVFVYYDVLDQALALSNVESMLGPGAFLLSNNSLLELPESRLRSVGYLTTQYSDRQDDGDHVVWYRRLD